MKTTITKKMFTFILLVSAMFSFSSAYAQNCPSNKVWACRVDACGLQECKCVSASQAQSWMSTIPPCGGNANGHNPFHNCCHGGTWRTGDFNSDFGLKSSLQAYPNPISLLTTISFVLEQSQKVALRIFDLNGKLVSTLADKIFEGGENELTWNTENTNSGIYFLHLESVESQERIKLIVTK